MLPRRLTALLLVLAILVTLGACLPPGRRLLSVEYRSGEDLLLTTYYEDSGREDLATIWGYLHELPIMVEEESVTLTPPADDPLRAVVAGTVDVVAIHGGDVLGGTALPGATFIRETTTDLFWHLADDE